MKARICLLTIIGGGLVSGLFFFHHEAAGQRKKRGTVGTIWEQKLLGSTVSAAPPECSQIVREFIAYISHEKPDIASDKAAQTRWLRAGLERRGFVCVAAPEHQGAGIVTIALPSSMRSTEVAAALEGEGFVVAAHSAYLVDRNWIQVSVMASPSRDDLRGLIDALCRTAC